MVAPIHMKMKYLKILAILGALLALSSCQQKQADFPVESSG